MATAVLEYQWRGYTPPGDGEAWSVNATITHAAGVIHSTSKELLADLREELKDAGLRKAGASIITKYSNRARPSQWFPRWREVWKGEEEEEEMNKLSPHAQKAQQASAGRTNLYWRRANAKRAQAMKPHEARLARLAASAEKKYPMAGRATKAAELVRRGHIQHNEGARFSVCSQAGSEIYLVHTERRTCTCYDFGSGNAPRINDAPMCKHRAACLMWLKVQAPNSAEIHRQEKQFRSALAAGMIT